MKITVGIAWLLWPVLVTAVQGEMKHKTCDSCLQLAGKDFGWCTTRVNNKVVGCTSISSLAQCSTAYEYSNSTATSSGQTSTMNPEKVTMTMRPNFRTEFELTASKADNAVDLYFLFDLSQSMDFIKSQLKSIAKDLAKEIEARTSSKTFGLGGFREKPVPPFDLKRDYEYDFEHLLTLEDDINAFIEKVGQTTLKGNYDQPEAGFDGLMQVLLCGENIGWRKDVTHVIIYLSDAVPHIAGDGILGGTWKPTENICKLERNGETSQYNSLVYDYPSISEINYQLEKQGKFLIFGVTSYVKPFYDELVTTGALKATVGLIGKGNNAAADLKNLVVDEYYKIQGKMAIGAKSDNPNINITLKFSRNSNCPEEVLTGATDRIECNKIKVDQPVKINAQVQISELACQSQTRPETFNPDKVNFNLQNPLEINFRIQVFGQQGSILEGVVNPHCACDCSSQTQGSPGVCNGNGNLRCNACICNNGYQGDNCECKTDGFSTEKSLLEKCSNENGVCNKHGECVCGICNCRDPLFGTKCECSKDDCHCENGDCDCVDGKVKCNCWPGWSNDTCSCPTSQEKCRDPFSKQVCNKNGQCSCGHCECNSGYEGAFCQQPQTAEYKYRDETTCAKIAPCLKLDTFAHVIEDESKRQNLEQECEKTGLKAQNRYSCFKVYNETDSVAIIETEDRQEPVGNSEATENLDSNVGGEGRAERKDGSTSHCRELKLTEMPVNRKRCEVEYSKCKFEFWHDAIQGIDNYTPDNFMSKTSIYIKYYNKVNNSDIQYNGNIDLDYTVTSVICPYFIEMWIIIAIVVGLVVIIFVALFAVYFILINLYDRWEYQRFLEATENIFETGHVKENPINRNKSRMSIRNLRNRMSRMSLRPS